MSSPSSTLSGEILRQLALTFSLRFFSSTEPSRESSPRLLLAQLLYGAALTLIATGLEYERCEARKRQNAGSTEDQPEANKAENAQENDDRTPVRCRYCGARVWCDGQDLFNPDGARHRCLPRALHPVSQPKRRPPRLKANEPP